MVTESLYLAAAGGGVNDSLIVRVGVFLVSCVINTRELHM